MLIKNKFKYFTILLVLLISCDPLESNSENYTDWSGWQQTPPEISIEVSSPAKVYRTDSVVDVQIILTNQSNNEISIGAGKSLSGQFEFDIAIVNKEKQKIWSRFPDDATYTLEMYTIHLKSGESYKMKDTWHFKDKNGHTIPPGIYKLYGGLYGLEVQIMSDGKTVNKKNFGRIPVGSDPVEIQVR